MLRGVQLSSSPCKMLPMTLMMILMTESILRRLMLALSPLSRCLLKMYRSCEIAPLLTAEARQSIRVLHTALCTLHTAHCTLQSAHCNLHTAHCTLHTSHYILNTAHY